MTKSIKAIRNIIIYILILNISIISCTSIKYKPEVKIDSKFTPTNKSIKINNLVDKTNYRKKKVNFSRLDLVKNEYLSDSLEVILTNELKSNLVNSYLINVTEETDFDYILDAQLNVFEINSKYNKLYFAYGVIFGIITITSLFIGYNLESYYLVLPPILFGLLPYSDIKFYDETVKMEFEFYLKNNKGELIETIKIRKEKITDIPKKEHKAKVLNNKSNEMLNEIFFKLFQRLEFIIESE